MGACKPGHQRLGHRTQTGDSGTARDHVLAPPSGRTARLRVGIPRVCGVSARRGRGHCRWWLVAQPQGPPPAATPPALHALRHLLSNACSAVRAVPHGASPAGFCPVEPRAHTPQVSGAPWTALWAPCGTGSPSKEAPAAWPRSSGWAGGPRARPRPGLTPSLPAFRLLRPGNQELRGDLKDFEGGASPAKHSSFPVSEEEKHAGGGAVSLWFWRA